MAFSGYGSGGWTGEADGASVGEGVGLNDGDSVGSWLGVAVFGNAVGVVVGDDVGSGGVSGSLSTMRAMAEKSGCLIPWRGSISVQDLAQTLSGSKSRLAATVRKSLDMLAVLFMGEIIRISRQSQRWRSKWRKN
jgi:hypothetical protein